MITNVSFNDSKKGTISAYATYCINPSKKHSEQTSDKERLVAFECNGALETPDARLANAFERDIRDFNRQWKQGRKLKDTSKDAVLGVISFGENDDVTPESALALAKEAVSRAMPGTRKTMFAVHNDANVLHVHFVASVVDMETGKAYAPTGEYGAMYRSWERVNEALEQENPGILQNVQQRYSEAKRDQSRSVEIKATKYASVKQVARAGLDSRPDVDLKTRVLEAYDTSTTFDEYLDNLELAGVRVVPNMGETKCSGLSYALLNDHDNRATKGSEFGKQFSFNNLSKAKNYDFNEHFGRLQQLREQTPHPTAARDAGPANHESRLGRLDAGTGSHRHIVENALHSTHAAGTGNVGYVGAQLSRRTDGRPSELGGRPSGNQLSVHPAQQNDGRPSEAASHTASASTTPAPREFDITDGQPSAGGTGFGHHQNARRAPTQLRTGKPLEHGIGVVHRGGGGGGPLVEGLGANASTARTIVGSAPVATSPAAATKPDSLQLSAEGQDVSHLSKVEAQSLGYIGEGVDKLENHMVQNADPVQKPATDHAEGLEMNQNKGWGNELSI